MENLKWVAMSGIGAILVFVAMASLLNSGGLTGAFPTGPTLADTGGVCIPNGEMGCANYGAVNCCHPAKCVQRVGAVYLTQGVCKIGFSTA